MANWLYNGVELPPLPEWDKATYPYTFIDCLDGEYELYVATVRSVRDGDTYGPERAGRGRLYNPNFADGTWEGGGRSLNYSEFSTFEEYPLIWTNHDMIDLADGSVYFAASTPIGAEKESGGERGWLEDYKHRRRFGGRAGLTFMNGGKLYE